MKRRIFLTMLSILTIYLNSIVNSQTISGKLSLLKEQKIQLYGFNGFNSYLISATKIDYEGNFKLTYSKTDYGIGYLISTSEKPFFVILSDEDIELLGQTLNYSEGIRILKCQENIWFEQYATEHPRREQALSAWGYLEKIYKLDSLFSAQQTQQKNIQRETQRIIDEDASFLANLPRESYVSWFLPIRKLVSSVSSVAQHRNEEISITITAFRNIDYSDSRLYKSGLFKDAIESHFWLLENCGKSLDSVFIEMQHSIDAMLEKLVMDETKLNEVTDFLFDLLERHSLYQASEYLALKVLNEVSCTIDSDLAKQLETYRAMKKGNTAPDIVFKGDSFTPGYAPTNSPKKLSDLNSKYTVVVFGASWCPSCKQEVPEIAKLYPKWKQHNVEVIFVSLDESKEVYHNFVKDFPFISTCDYQKWGSPIVNDYYVFGTPTMFLLDAKREILLRPNSLKQMDAWVDWFLVQGNK